MATATRANTDAAMEASNQAEYDFYLLDAPIEDFAKYAGISIDEAVNRRVYAARQIVDLSQIDVTVRLLNQPQGKMIGLATVEYHGFRMENFKVFNGENGLFLGEPTARDGRTNNFVKTIRISGAELRDALNQKAFEGYNVAVEKLNARAAEAKNMAVKPSEIRPPSYKEQFDKAAKEAAKHNAARPDPAKGDKKKAVEERGA
jgi:DNA-binding cell septation regulator SpoVG